MSNGMSPKLASFYIKYKTPDFYYLSLMQYTIPQKKTMQEYKNILNQDGIELLETILDKVSKEEYTDELFGHTKSNAIIWGYSDSGSWIANKRHPFKVNTGINAILCAKDNWFIMGFSNNKQANIQTSIIRLLDPQQKWVYTISGSLYKLSVQSV